jgi:arylsulfatase
MKRRNFLAGVAASGALSVSGWRSAVGSAGRAEAAKGELSSGSAEESPGSSVQKRAPNILLLLPDQWRFDWMSSNPDLPIRTPNLDRIAQRGTRFTNVIVGCPLCAPSRACLASGTEYGKSGVRSNLYDYPVDDLYSDPIRPTFYSMLRDGGYQVLGCGKLDLAKVSNWWGNDGMWRLPSLGFSKGINSPCKGDQPRSIRFSNGKPGDPYLIFLQSQGLLEKHLDDFAKRQKGQLYGATFATPLPDHAYGDNWIGQNGLDLLDAAPKDKPWYLQVNWTGPHCPLDITSRMESEVRGRTMPGANGKNEFSLPVNQEIRENYTAMCENIDRVIGLYLDKLSRMGELDNTIIVFSSDHGEMLGDHGRWAKMVPYQPSTSVPMIVAGPGVKHGVTSAALVSLIDLTATFLDYAGLPRPGDMDSRSIRPVLEGNAERHREFLVSALGGWQMAYDGQYKVVRGFNTALQHNSSEWTPCSKEVQGLPLLAFDLVQDPKENTNLSLDMPRGAQRVLEMVPPAGCA